MAKRLLFVITMYTFILVGCQNDKFNIPADFTEKQTFMSKDLSINKTFILEDIILVGLGDSLTQGVGDEHNFHGYIGRLKEEMSNFTGVKDVELFNLAKRGKRSDQLLEQLKSGEVDEELRKADFIMMTIGGNDIMRIVKQDLFRLRIDAFQNELIEFTQRYQNSVNEIRKLNPDAPIVLIGLYNPFSVVTDQKNEFDQIVMDWNKSIKNVVSSDTNACFVPVDDLFNSNIDLVYHTDFFHPNSKGYEHMTDRILESLETCGLNKLTNGEIDF
ncbi:GDSL-type esterase/lipase family protein [Paenisporosarcina indica]|uniref:GDSL-type esterase/lipase family protein n=1 Tax=Paenisporosarcina indica TaxID=650093 RepID=UPI00094FCBD6|nr:GDSL-type esterase/lipase family protein [Paenisporosarcina indica]